MIEDMHADDTVSAPLRIFAGLAGVVVFLFSALVSHGSSLVAPLGILAAGAVARRKGSAATRGTTWIGAIIASMAALILGAGVIVAILPAGVRQQIRAGMDSAQTATRAQQAEELARRGIQTGPVADRIINAPTFNIWVAVVTGMMTIGFLGAMAGSAGWAAMFLLAGAFTGRWPWGGGPSAPRTGA